MVDSTLINMYLYKVAASEPGLDAVTQKLPTVSPALAGLGTGSMLYGAVGKNGVFHIADNKAAHAGIMQIISRLKHGKKLPSAGATIRAIGKGGAFAAGTALLAGAAATAISRFRKNNQLLDR